MSFKEKFPNLAKFARTKKQIEEHDKKYENQLWIFASQSSDGICGYFPDYEAQTYVNTIHVENTCLDKQRVREAFEEILENATDLDWVYRVKDAKNELGL